MELRQKRPKNGKKISDLNCRGLDFKAVDLNFDGKTDEFEQITVSMKEGLILLNDHGIILTINPIAKALFETEEE